MTYNPKVHFIPAKPPKREKRVGIYCRVSTNDAEQLNSLEEVYEKSVETVKILGEGGGYLFSPTHAVTPDIPVENIRAMLEAVKSVTW